MKCATILFVLSHVTGCELVLGDLPTPKEELSTTGSTVSTGSVGGSTTTPSSGGQGGSTASSATSGPSSTSTSTSGVTSGSGGEGGCCDCDHDNHLAEGLCGGDDCDDSDDLTYEDEPIYYTEASPKGDFDWDCDGTPEPDPAMDILVKCGLVGLPCNAKTGFLNTVPTCGGTGTWGTCSGTILPCVDQPIEQGKKMACK